MAPLRATDATQRKRRCQPLKMGQFCPSQCPQAQRSPRKYLTPKEVERVIAAARQNRYGHRDATMILIANRHGLRVAELCALRWDQVDFEHGLLHVRRIKN